MVKAQSVATVAEIADQFRTSSAAVITEYRGLTMKQITNLRRALGSTTQYTVAKNTLVKRAAADAGVQGLDDLFTGPTAIAFVKGEPSEAAKAIREFAKTNPLLVVKGGFLEGRPLQVADVAKLADLESREVLLAKFAGAMKANLSKAAAVFIQLPSQMARLAAALQEKLAAEAPAEAEAAVVEAPVVAEEAPVVTEAEAAEVEAPVVADAEAAVVEAPVVAEVEAEAEAEAEAATVDTAEAEPETTTVDTAEAEAEASTVDTAEADTAEADTAEAEANIATESDAGTNSEVQQAEAASTEAPADLA